MSCLGVFCQEIGVLTGLELCDSIEEIVGEKMMGKKQNKLIDKLKKLSRESFQFQKDFFMHDNPINMQQNYKTVWEEKVSFNAIHKLSTKLQKEGKSRSESMFLAQLHEMETCLCEDLVAVMVAKNKSDLKNKYQQFIFDYACYAHKKYDGCSSYLGIVTDNSYASFDTDSCNITVNERRFFDFSKFISKKELKRKMLKKLAIYVRTMEHEYAHYWDYKTNLDSSVQVREAFNNANWTLACCAGKWPEYAEEIKNWQLTLYAVSPSENFARFHGGADALNFFHHLSDYVKTPSCSAKYPSHQKSVQRCAERLLEEAHKVRKFDFDFIAQHMKKYDAIIPAIQSSLLKQSFSLALQKPSELYLCKALLEIPGLYDAERAEEFEQECQKLDIANVQDSLKNIVKTDWPYDYQALVVDNKKPFSPDNHSALKTETDNPVKEVNAFCAKFDNEHVATM